MSRLDLLLDDLADAVLDGSAVDWAEAESRVDDSERRIVGHLRVVSSVAQLHRDLLPRDVPAPPHSGDTLPFGWGHLRLLERIGSGAFGDVFRAWDPRLDREVALKLLQAEPSSHPELERTIIREGRLLAKVQHPNIVTIYGAERIGDRIGLWMELVLGRTLEQMLQQEGRFRPADAVRVGLELCRAVSAVHAAGLLHRDIKAHNVMCREDGRIALMDFGAGLELDDRVPADAAGTPLYLAPEVLAGEPATVRSEVYSIGVLLYHLLTGSYPVRGRTVRDVQRAHQDGHRISLRRVRPRLPRALARVIERAVDPVPSRRYPDAAALERDLLALQHGRAVRLLRYGMAAAATLLLSLAAWELYARVRADRPGPIARFVALTSGMDARLVQSPTVVVLPFENAGDGTGTDLLVDSITVGLIRQLAAIEGLEIRSPESSFRLRGAPRDLSYVGKRLGANVVVEGAARVSGGTLRITAALVAIDDDARLWSDTIERPIESEGDVTAAIETLAGMIVNRLRLPPGPARRRYAIDIPTFQMYLRARALRDERGDRARQAVPLFQEVIRKAPTFPDAHAALAATYGYLAVDHPTAERFTLPPRDAATLIEPLTRRALAIDPALAEAHAALGFLHAIEMRWAEAEASFRHAISLDPSLTSVYGDLVLSALLPSGRLDDSLQTIEAALQADPLSLDLRRMLARVQINAGMYDQALDNCRYVLDVDPAFPFARQIYTWGMLVKGERTEALKLFEEYSAGRPGVRGYIHALNGERAEAERIARQFGHLPQRQAEIYGLMGDTDRAFEAIERLALVNPIRAASELSRPELGLADDPRGTALRRKLGFAAEARD